MTDGRRSTRAGGRGQHGVAIAAGFAINLAVSAITGRREAWDSPLYFVVGVPLMCVVVGWLAYRYPHRAWRWTLGVALGQSLAMALAGSSLSLWPLALVATVIVSLPQFLTGLIVSRIATRQDAEEEWHE